MTRKWNIANDNLNSNYVATNEITYNTEILKYILCGYNENAYILVTGDITVIAASVTQVEYKNCAPFTKCITKVDGTTIDYAEDLDLVMSVYNLTECSSTYSETIGRVWFYSKDEATDFNANIVNDIYFKSFKYEAKLLGNTVAQANNDANGIIKTTTIAVPLKYLSNFWRSLEMSLINCKVELKLKWSKYCVLSAAGNDNANGNDDNIIFTIKDTKLYVPVVTLSARDNKKLTKLLSKRFERWVY